MITGPPAAGKSSWIQARAQPTDVVIDLDRITLALSGPGAPQWNQDPILKRVALRARHGAVEEAITHRDKRDVYLIHTMPSPKALARYRRLDATVIAVDPGRDIVMQRVQDMRDPAMTAVATRWYTYAAKHQTQTVTKQASRDW